MYVVLAWLLYGIAMVSIQATLETEALVRMPTSGLGLYALFMLGTALFVGLVQSTSRPRHLYLVLSAIVLPLSAMIGYRYGVGRESWVDFIVVILGGVWLLVEHLFDARRARCSACGRAIAVDAATSDAGELLCSRCQTGEEDGSEGTTLVGHAVARYAFPDPLMGRGNYFVRYVVAAIVGLVGFYLAMLASLILLLAVGYQGLPLPLLFVGGVSGFVVAGIIRPQTGLRAALVGLAAPVLLCLLIDSGLANVVAPILSMLAEPVSGYVAFFAILSVGGLIGGWLCFDGRQ